jgi:predicted DNA-binding ribbon-helix-helix protein
VRAAADDVPGVLKKRSFSIAGHRTSVALEPEFWSVLEGRARDTSRSLAALVARVDASRAMRPLASALRLEALDVALKTENRSPAE